MKYILESVTPNRQVIEIENEIQDTHARARTRTHTHTHTQALCDCGKAFLSPWDSVSSSVTQGTTHSHGGVEC